jgi:TRAP-type C4-dicarboxylate transport system substrate-binding protein
MGKTAAFAQACRAASLRRRFALLVAAMLLAAPLAPSQTLIRMGTLAPKGSRWEQILLEMGAKWKQATNGRLTLRLYAGGEQGDEPEMVQKMRIRKLQSVALSGAGLSGIDASVSALQIPLMFNSYEELDYVRDKISPRLEKLLAARGYIVLNWADAGWVRFFSREPAYSPDDFRKLKLCVLQGDSATFELYKNNGFHPVALAATDILTGLQTGLIDAFQAPALVALGSQWFGGARNMLDLKLATLVGATLISKDVWNKLSPDDQRKVMDISRESGVELRKEIRSQEANAIGLMQSMGLNEEKISPQAAAQWRTLIEGKLYPALRSHGMPPELFDEVVHLRDEYRAAHSTSPARPAAKGSSKRRP